MSIASLGRACMGHSLCSPCAPDRRVCAQHAGNASYSACAQRGVAFKPRKGDALLFYSLKPNGELDTLSLHGCALHALLPHLLMRRAAVPQTRGRWRAGRPVAVRSRPLLRLHPQYWSSHAIVCWFCMQPCMAL